MAIPKNNKEIFLIMYPNMDTASNYSAGDPKKNSEAHKTSGLYTITNYSKMLYHVNFIKCKISSFSFSDVCINICQGEDFFVSIL